MAPHAKGILTINSGSSSLKFALYDAGKPHIKLIVRGAFERIGLEHSLFRAEDADGHPAGSEHDDLPNHDAALAKLFDWMTDRSLKFFAVGHRVVHGGSCFEHRRVDHGLVRHLTRLIRFAPEHQPPAIAGIEAVSRRYPRAEQVACFDTAFHRSMPRVHRLVPLPRRFAQAGVERCGFHGLSYQSILEQLRAADSHTAAGRIVIAHLGNGASMAALREGSCVETTMGFTPAGGLMMGTRSGDLDPGVVLFAAEQENLDPPALRRLINHESGLLGVSELSSDMKDLLAAEARNESAADAVALFCHQARKCLGGLIAVLGGLDTLVFTGGIGQKSPQIRTRICAGFEFLRLVVDDARNAASDQIISPKDSGVTVRVMKTDEEQIVASITHGMI